jgi:hypothetical protein
VRGVDGSRGNRYASNTHENRLELTHETLQQLCNHGCTTHGQDQANAALAAEIILKAIRALT